MARTKIHKMPYPQFETDPTCPVCGLKGEGPNEHNIQFVVETHKDLSVSLYVFRTCGGCGFSWGEQMPTAQEKKDRNSDNIVGFTASKDTE